MKEQDQFHPPFKDDKGFTHHVKKNPVMDNILFPPRKKTDVIIFLDFDGTCVEHQYPEIGRENFGCVRIIGTLQAKGYVIALNSMRGNFQKTDPDGLRNAIRWLTTRNIVIDLVMQEKLNPSAWLSYMKFVGYQGEKKAICIDDQALGMPLKPAVMTPGNMVDWTKVESDLREAGIL